MYSGLCRPRPFHVLLSWYQESHKRSFFNHLHHEIFQFTVDDSINFIEAHTSLTFQLNANLVLLHYKPLCHLERLCFSILFIGQSVSEKTKGLIAFWIHNESLCHSQNWPGEQEINQSWKQHETNKSTNVHFLRSNRWLCNFSLYIRGSKVILFLRETARHLGNAGHLIIMHFAAGGHFRRSQCSFIYSQLIQ